MSTEPRELPAGEKWGSKLGVVLAVAGSAVGLGNFLRFPGVAVNNGGGAFMIPYIISFLVLGIPIAWCEWTMGRLGGRYRQNNAPGIMYAIWRRGPAKGLGALALLIPVTIYMYYVLLEAWCLDYCLFFIQGGFADLFAEATAQAAGHAEQVQAVVGATGDHQGKIFGAGGNGALLEEGRTIWLVLACFLVNYFVIYKGVTRGIEVFCKWAMPALLVCAIIILIRVLTLPGISSGLGFMWNPDWVKLRDPQVWLEAAGQIFFSLSVGFGIILCYSSYLRKDDDVALTALSAASTNEFCEVILGGMIVVPTAFLFLGAENATAGTFGLGFVTVPAIMHFMPLGQFFGAMWFGLLFFAAVTSSLSMLQPAIAFLEDGFGIGRRASVSLLGIITAFGAGLTIYFSKGVLALDYADHLINLCMILAATGTVLIFGWALGAERGVVEMNRGSDFRVPGFIAFTVRYVTPTFLLVILIAWAATKSGDYVDGMSPETRARDYARAVYVEAIGEHLRDDDLSEEGLATRTDEILGPEGEAIVAASLPEWLGGLDEKLAEAQASGRTDANVARFVFIGIGLFLILLIVLIDIACRNRIGRTIEQAEQAGVGLEEASA